MDYEQLYKEALERAKNLRKDAIDMGENLRAKQCEIIFPELAEREDERIRKGIINYLSWIEDRDGSYMPNSIPFDDMLAWLEKQSKENMIEALRLEYEKGKADGLQEQREEWSEEDERIRKRIIATISLYYGEPLEEEAKEMIAWLEKQNKQILANSAKTCKDEQKHSNLESNGEDWNDEDEKEWRDIINKFTRMEWFDELNFLRYKLKR